MSWADFYLGLRLRLEPGELLLHLADALPEVRYPQLAMRREQDRAERVVVEMSINLIAGRDHNPALGEHYSHNRGERAPAEQPAARYRAHQESITDGEERVYTMVTGHFHPMTECISFLEYVGSTLSEMDYKIDLWSDSPGPQAAYAQS